MMKRKWKLLLHGPHNICIWQSYRLIMIFAAYRCSSSRSHEGRWDHGCPFGMYMEDTASIHMRPERCTLAGFWIHLVSIQCLHYLTGDCLASLSCHDHTSALNMSWVVQHLPTITAVLQGLGQSSRIWQRFTACCSGTFMSHQWMCLCRRSPSLRKASP